nr:MAG TPA: hypothetical protein [Caudoviricetes sp.]
MIPTRNKQGKHKISQTMRRGMVKNPGKFN